MLHNPLSPEGSRQKAHQGHPGRELCWVSYLCCLGLDYFETGSCRKGLRVGHESRSNSAPWKDKRHLAAIWFPAATQGTSGRPSTFINVLPVEPREATTQDEHRTPIQCRNPPAQSPLRTAVRIALTCSHMPTQEPQNRKRR